MCDRCDDLEERVAWLESELGLRGELERVDVFRAAGLAPAEGLLVSRLYAARGRVVSREQLEEALPAIDPAGERVCHIVRCYVSRVRAKLGHDAIATIWGGGYRLTDHGMTTVAAFLGPREAAVAA